jgi:hypothetical protein
MTDSTAALAAIIMRLTHFIGRAATFPTPSGRKVTGTLTEYRLGEEHGGNVQVRFREDPTEWFEVTGFPTAPRQLPGSSLQIEQEGSP